MSPAFLTACKYEVDKPTRFVSSSRRMLVVTATNRAARESDGPLFILELDDTKASMVGWFHLPAI